MEKSDELPEEDGEVLQKFWRDLQIQDYSKARIYKLVNTMVIIAEWMDVTLSEADKDDIKDLIA